MLTRPSLIDFGRLIQLDPVEAAVSRVRIDPYDGARDPPGCTPARGVKVNEDPIPNRGGLKLRHYSGR